MARKIKSAYFRNPRSHMVYGAFGGSAESNIAGGFCLNGLCVSLQKVGGKDAALHQAVRRGLGCLQVISVTGGFEGLEKRLADSRRAGRLNPTLIRIRHTFPFPLR